MKFTENFNLNLPDLDDMADVEKLNENFQKIDESMKSLETDPELAANVVDINNKIGTEGDADTQPTLFGRLAQLKKVLLEKLAELLTKITGIDGKIGTSSDTTEDETLFGRSALLSNKMESFAEYGLDLFQTNKLEGMYLTNPTLKNEQKIVLFKKVGQFVCESSGKISIKATMTYRIKTTASSSTSLLVNYVLNNKSYAEMDMGATSNQNNIENRGATLVKTSFNKDTDNVWSQPATVSDDSNVIEVSKGDVLTFFIGSRASEGSSYTYYWDIQNATVEGFSIR